MLAREINSFTVLTCLDEQSSASGHDYASDRSAIGADCFTYGIVVFKYVNVLYNWHFVAQL